MYIFITARWLSSARLTLGDADCSKGCSMLMHRRESFGNVLGLQLGSSALASCR